MKSSAPDLTTLTRSNGGVRTQAVLNDEGMACSLLTIPSGETIDAGGVRSTHDHLFFVVDGAVEIEVDGVTVILPANHAQKLGRGKRAEIRNKEARPATVLRVDVKAPPLEAPLYTLPKQG